MTQLVNLFPLGIGGEGLLPLGCAVASGRDGLGFRFNSLAVCHLFLAFKEGKKKGKQGKRCFFRYDLLLPTPEQS
jgi:hypothetical protein